MNFQIAVKGTAWAHIHTLVAFTWKQGCRWWPRKLSPTEYVEIDYRQDQQLHHDTFDIRFSYLWHEWHCAHTDMSACDMSQNLTLWHKNHDKCPSKKSSLGFGSPTNYTFICYTMTHMTRINLWRTSTASTCLFLSFQILLWSLPDAVCFLECSAKSDEGRIQLQRAVMEHLVQEKFQGRKEWGKLVKLVTM